MIPRSTTSSSSYCLSLSRRLSLCGETSATGDSTSTSTSTLSNSTTTASRPEAVSSQRIRSRYFDKLGVGRHKVAKAGGISTKTQQSQQGRKNDRAEIEPCNSVTRTLTSSGPQHSSFKNSHSHHRSSFSQVSFEAQVSIRMIPHHSQYTSNEKEMLWTSPDELEDMAFRNYVEFAMDEWDWRQAKEESEFVLLPEGNWVHPATIDWRTLQNEQQQLQQQTCFCNPQRQFCVIFSAQQQQQHRRQQRSTRQMIS